MNSDMCTCFFKHTIFHRLIFQEQWTVDIEMPILHVTMQIKVSLAHFPFQREDMSAFFTC